MPTFKWIRDLLARDLNKPIEEVIRLSQTDEEVVYTELSEYVVTDNLRRAYTDLLRAVLESRHNPTEGIAVWVSGFFGSGKSAFVKNLGYILGNPLVKGESAAELFIERVREAAAEETELPDLIRALTRTLQFEVIMFDVSAARAVQREDERLAEVMYRELLRNLDYAYRSYEVAELEIELEAEGRLAEFVKTVARLAREKGWGPRSLPSTVTLPETLRDRVPEEDYALWQRIRTGAQAINRASEALHRMDPGTYPQPTTWAKVVRARPVDITVHLLIDRTFELMRRRRPGRVAFFIIDEVGQYVARSADKILDLQGVVREFGTAGRNRTVRGETPAPVWIVVTSQEKLSEVVDAIGDKRIELAKLQDSFRYHIDLGPQDIQEVASRRVLVKKPEAIPFLENLFERHRGTLNNAVSLEQTGRFVPVEKDAFVETYPYLPHLIGLSIDIMSALRLQTGGLRHLGGSNRTIIKQAYEMLVNKRTNLAEAPVGTLVTLDKVYELVEHNLSSEKQRDIHDIDQKYGPDSWEARVARVLALVEGVKHLPRTERNIAALLYDRLGADFALDAVRTALERLEQDHFVRQAEGGWKLLTLAEKTWDAERREIRVTLSQETNLLREALERLWEDPGLHTVAYSDMHNFRLQVFFQGHALDRRGDLEFHLELVEEDKEDRELKERVQAARQETRTPSHRHEIRWIFPRTQALSKALQELARSAEMVRRYEQEAAQRRLGDEHLANLENEKRRRQYWQSEVDRLLKEALLQGVGVFQGMTKRPADFHARTWKDVVRGMVHWVVPQLYTRLEEGKVRLSDRAAEKVLQTRDLSHLPPEFYDVDGGLGLVQQGPEGYMLNQDAPVAAAILAYFRQEEEYGQSVTGKKLEEHFKKPPFGWRLELVQAVLALLLREGLVEIVAQGRRLHRSEDPQVRRALQNIREFRNTTFRRRKPLDIRIRAQAGRTLQELTGEEVPPEETALFEKARTWAREVLGEVRLTQTRLQDAGLMALLAPVREAREQLEALLNQDSQDVVSTLAERGRDLVQALKAYHHVRPVVEDENLQLVRQAREVLRDFWPDIAAEAPEGLQERVHRARNLLDSADLPDHLGLLHGVVSDIQALHRRTYEKLHQLRGEKYTHALAQVQAWPEWEQVPEAEREGILRDLMARACTDLDYDEATGRCRRCHARIATMRSDLRAVQGYLEEARQALQERLPEEAPARPVVQLRLRDLAPTSHLRTPEDVDALLAALRQALLEHIQQGREVEIA